MSQILKNYSIKKAPQVFLNLAMFDPTPIKRKNMNTSFLGLGSLFAIALLVACAPGSARQGGIGCSKTSSVLKAPQIRSTTEFLRPPSSAQQRDRVMKFLVHGFNPAGQSLMTGVSEPLKTTGGYIYINSRRAGDPLGLLKAADGSSEGELKRCSILVEFPKNRGEIAAPSSLAQVKFPSDSGAIDNFRFPSSSDPMRVRIYTAAHCLDYSLADSAQLSIFNASGTSLPSFAEAYLTFSVKVPEFEEVKKLRKAIRAKIRNQTITEAEGIKILNALRPATANLDRIFGAGTPAEQQACAIDTRSNSVQYSCATYHDMAVLDLDLDNQVSPEVLSRLRQIRTTWVGNIKDAEEKGPWVEYVKPAENLGSPNQMRIFVDTIMMNASIDPTLKDDSGSTDSSGKCVSFPTYNFGSVGGMGGTELKTKLGLFHPSPANCLEVPLNSSANLAYVRYITRERLHSFSRFNMISMVRELGNGLAEAPLNLDQCGATPTGICSLKDDINQALAGLLPGLNLSQVNSQFENNYGNATKYVDAVLSVWNPFFAIANQNKVSTEDIISQIGGTPVDTNFLNSLINPIDFLRLNSNYILLENTEALPDASNVDLHRGFMAMPMPGIVGMESFSFIGDTPSIPIEIKDWTSSGIASGFGKFLKMTVNTSTLNDYFQSKVDADVYSPTLPGMLQPGESIPPADAIFVDDTNPSSIGTFILPTKVFMQKGDSGSIFTLDSIPAFALSTVNGEATSGGAAVRAVPIADEDVSDLPPSGAPNSRGNNPAGTTAAVTCK
jgi:hypothetical protein